MRAGLPYAVCVLAAVLVRVVDLGERPLSSAEAVASWTAWTAATNAPMPAVAGELPHSALLHAMQSTVFWIGGSGDAAARLPAALAGVIPVLLVWMLRDTLGRSASIALAVMLAVDPLAVAWSRLADDAALTGAAGWGVILCAAAIATPGISNRRRDICACALPVAAGLLLVSGPLAWQLLPPLALGVALLHPIAPGCRPSAGRPDLQVGREAKRAVSIVAATAVVAGTAALTQPDGLQLVSSAAGASVRIWATTPAFSFGDLWSTLLRFERLLLVIGCVGLVLGALAFPPGPSRVPPVPIFSKRVLTGLVVWFLWGVFLTAAPGRSSALWLIVQPPLLLGAAWLTAGAIERLSRDRPDGRHPRWAGLGWTVAAVLALDLTGNAARLAADRHARWFRPYEDVTEPAVRRLADDIAVLLGNSGARLHIVGSHGADPVLGWALRSQPGVAWVAAPDPAAPGAPYVLAEATVNPGVDLASSYPLRARAGAREHVTLGRNAGVQ